MPNGWAWMMRCKASGRVSAKCWGMYIGREEAVCGTAGRDDAPGPAQ
jgi:hypothetical protein